MLSTVTQHMQDKQGIRPSQRGFLKGKSHLTVLIRRPVDVARLDVRKAFDLFLTVFSWRRQQAMA